jgi:hypothetical protein
VPGCLLSEGAQKLAKGAASFNADRPFVNTLLKTSYERDRLGA